MNMAIGPDLQTRLTKKYQPSALVFIDFRGKDVAVQTNNEGDAIVAFIGKMGDNGKIKGERYTRTLKYGPGGKVIKDHWDLKGKV